ncbi:RlmI/RlmK family 23S rRNA methyltransferase, partial [Paenibacillus phytohabitans]
MGTEMTIRVKSNLVNKYREGYPLITKEIMNNINPVEEGALLNLVDETHSFIAKGYYGKQNKGYGWVLTRNKDERIDQTFFERKMKADFDKRRSFYKDEETTAFRVFNGEGDGIGGFTIDYFAGYYLINWYSKGIYAYYEHVLASLKNLVEYKAIYQKKRFRADGKFIEEDGFVDGKRGQFPIIVKENGVNFAIYFNEEAMVGVFLDQRDVRRT